jgi:hypothetical protein
VSSRRAQSCERRIGGESDHFDTELVPVECDDAAMKTHFGVDPLMAILSGPSEDPLPGLANGTVCGRGCWAGERIEIYCCRLWNLLRRAGGNQQQ